MLARLRRWWAERRQTQLNRAYTCGHGWALDMLSSNTLTLDEIDAFTAGGFYASPIERMFDLGAMAAVREYVREHPNADRSTQEI